MPALPLLFPPPADTARAAKAVFNLGKLYLIIGDQMELLFAGVDLVDLDALGGQSSVFFVRLALTEFFALLGSSRNDSIYETPNLCGQSLEKISSDQEIVRTNVAFR